MMDIAGISQGIGMILENQKAIADHLNVVLPWCLEEYNQIHESILMNQEKTELKEEASYDKSLCSM